MIYILKAGMYLNVMLIFVEVIHSAENRIYKHLVNHLLEIVVQ